MEGKCVAKVTTTTEPKKKKKKKKSKKGNAQEEEEDNRRTFPWYHILAPLSLATITYKYSEPNLVTSALLVLVLAIAAI